MNKEIKLTRLIPCNEWNRYHPWPPAGGLRYLVFNAEHNGFKKVIRRIGRRVLIDERAFFDYIEEKNKEGCSETS